MRLADLDGCAVLPDSVPFPLDRPFTAKQAAAEGVTRRQLGWLVRQGFLRRMLKGVYVATQVGDSTRLRCQALGLVVPTDSVVCDRHAGWLHGAEMVLAPNEHIDLRPISIFRPAGHGRLRNELADSGERNLRPDDIVEVHGMRVTTPLRTAWDLGRVRYPDRALAGIDQMLRLGAFDHGELLQGVERFRGMRWVTVLRAVAPLADGRAASPGESVLRLRWIEARIPAPTPQLAVYRGEVLVGILDLANEEIRYAAEYDGAEWHSSPEQREHDRERRAEMSEDDWDIDVFVAADLFGRQANPEARLRDGAGRARRRLGLRVSG